MTNLHSKSVSVIDTASNTVAAEVTVESDPLGVAITPDGTRAYVTNKSADAVSVIDTSTNTVLTTVPLGGPPWGVAITPPVRQHGAL